MAASTVADINPKYFVAASATAVFPTAAHAAASATYAGSIFSTTDRVYIHGILFPGTTGAADTVTIVDSASNDVLPGLVLRSSSSGPMFIDCARVAVLGGFGVKSTNAVPVIVIYTHEKNPTLS